MDDFLDLPTLIAIAVAVFVLFRLRSVLGTRTGNERPPVDRTRSSRTEKAGETVEETVVPLRPRAAQPELDDERRARREGELLSDAVGDGAANKVGQDRADGVDKKEIAYRFIIRQVLTALKSGEHAARQRGQQTINKDAKKAYEHQKHIVA